jgi:hypothetical protein
LEIHISWPALDSDFDEKCSLERLLLLIQISASKNKLKYRLFGKWPASAHLVIQIPIDRSASDILAGPITDCFTQAGFIHWSYLEGSPSPNVLLVVEPHHDFNRMRRISQEEGVCWVRIYGRQDTSFEDVLHSVRGFIPKNSRSDSHNKNV